MSRPSRIPPVALALVLALVACPAAAGAAAAPAPASDATVARGSYLVKIMGCNDCHTPFKMTAQGPAPDMTRMLSGHPQEMVITAAPKPAGGPWIASIAATNTAWAGPWGVSFTANLTPDPETGLGKWSQRNFMDAIRTGRHQGRGRPILPPMPIQVYKNFTDQDLGAIYAYLRTIPAIRNAVPEPLPPPPEAAPAPK